MQLQIKQIVLQNRYIPPYFILSTTQQPFQQSSIIIKVISFSIDPVMRVWLSGAKTNFRKVNQGDVFNCFGLGQVIQSKDEDYPKDTYLFGNTGTCNYFQLTQQKKKQVFHIDKQLVNMYGPQRFMYLINNGLAAFHGFELMEVQKGENVVVSTAAGATGLLLCHLLKKSKANIIALTSPSKFVILEKYTNIIFDYKDKNALRKKLKQLKFKKYFDNVGQSLLNLILSTIEKNGIIAMCGTIDNYLDPKNGGIQNYTQVISKSLKLQGVNFSYLIPRAKQIFQKYKQADIIVKVIGLNKFNQYFQELYRSGGSIIGKIVINPHLNY